MRLKSVVMAKRIIPASMSCGNVLRSNMPARSIHMTQREEKLTMGTSAERILRGAYAAACWSAWPHSWAATAAAATERLL